MSDTATKSVADPGFPRGGTNSKGGHQPIIQANFPENYMKSGPGVHRKFIYVDLPVYILNLKIFFALKCDPMHRIFSAEVKDLSQLFKITLIPVHLIRICFK